MNYIPNITIKYREPNVYTKVHAYSIAEFCPGHKAKSPNRIIKLKSGCQIPEDAIDFSLEPSTKTFVLSVNKSFIQFDENTDSATVVCLLSGNSKFTCTREVTLNFTKERLDCIDLQCGNIYLNGDSSQHVLISITSKVNIESIILKCGDEKKPPFNLKANLSRTIDFGEVHYSVNMQHKEIKVIATSEWTKQVEATFHVYPNNLKWDDENKSIKVYRNDKTYSYETELWNYGSKEIKGIEVVEVPVDSKTIDISPNRIPSIGAGQSQKISVLQIKPDFTSGERRISISASYMDGKLSTPFNLEVKTLDTISPKLRLSKQLLSDEEGNPVKYYVGQGKALIGTITVACEKIDRNIPDDAYLPIDLVKTPPICCETDKLVLEPQLKNPVIKIGKTVVYDMSLDLPTGFEIERDDYGDGWMSLSVRIGEASSSFRIPIEQQKKTLFIQESKRYSKVFCGKCSYHIFDINLRYDAPAEGDFSCRHHCGGFISISGDERVSFNNNYIERELPITSIQHGDKSISVYYIAPDEWNNLENIQVTHSLKKIRVKYSEYDNHRSCVYEDSLVLSTNKITRLDDEPQLVLFYLDQEGTEIDVYSDSLEKQGRDCELKFTAPAIEYSPNCDIYKTDPPFSLFFRNAQTLDKNRQALSIRNIKCTCNKIKKIPIDDFSIKNGGSDVVVDIVSDYSNRSFNEISFVFDLYKNDESPLHVSLDITIPREEKTDVWHSLDLGTSGIVVASFDGDKGDKLPHIIPLRDEDENSRIEENEGILSSATIIKKDDSEEMGVLHIAPSKGDLYSNMRVLPCKFLAGRTVLPMVDTYIRGFPNGIIIGNSDYSWKDDIVVKEIIKETYRDVFGRISPDESENVRKLVVTYPNTYTPFLLNELRKLIIKERLFYNLLSEDLSFVPESDAVIAYYVNYVMQKGKGFGPNDKQTIVVYDMGAGTLDLTLATLEKRDKKLFITLDKRLGLPIGGAYISEVLYRFLESEGAFLPYGQSEDSIKERRRKRHELTEEVKYNLGNGKLFSYEDDDRRVLSRDIDDTTFESCNELNDIIKLCTEDVFCYLTGVKDWSSCIDKVIFSGRGSLFNPIREKIIKHFGEEKVYPVEQLKTCVAIGAIQYQRIRENLDDRFEIIHKNTYHNIGVYYCFLNDNFQEEYDYCEIVSSKDTKYNDKENPEFGVLEGHNAMPIDLSITQEAIIFATPFDKDTMKEILMSKEDIRRCMITHLLSFNTNGVNHRERVTFSIMSDIDGTLSIKINNAELKKIQLVERIEENKYYQHYYSY